MGGLLVSDRNLPAGIAWFVVGAIYVAGEAWLSRRGEQHPTFAVSWWLTWTITAGAALIAVGAIYRRWDSIVLFVFGTSQLALGGFGAVMFWRERHQSSPGDAAE